MSSLQGYTIAFAGSLKGSIDDTLASLRNRIKDAGGACCSKIASATHVVVSPAQFRAKITEAIGNPSIAMVNFQWLIDSLAATAPVDESPYHPSAPTPQTSNPTSHTTTLNPKATTQTVASSTKKTTVPFTRAQKRAHGTNSDKEAPNPNDSIKPKQRKRIKRDGQLAKSLDLFVPVDRHYPNANNSRVYVDPNGVIWDAMMTFTDSAKNHNKFLIVQVLVDKNPGPRPVIYLTYTRCGRIGTQGRPNTFAEGQYEGGLIRAKNVFENKFRHKTGLDWSNRMAEPQSGRYTFLQRTYDDSSSDEELLDTSRRLLEEKIKSEKANEAILSPSVQRLMTLIFDKNKFANALAKMNYDKEKLPLGRLLKATLIDGYAILEELAEVIKRSRAMPSQSPDDVKVIEDLSNKYLSLIPHYVKSRAKPPIIDSPELIKQELDLLESLSDMRLTDKIMRAAEKKHGHSPQMQSQYQSLNLKEMTPLSSDTDEFREIEKYLHGTSGVTHYMTFKLEDIFRIERSGENARLEGFIGGMKSDRRLLWHGSPSTNFGGILSQGLRIAPPEAPQSGYAFGKGIYLADMSSKSANYCLRHRANGDSCLLLLCEVELGQPMYDAYHGDYNAAYNAALRGCIATRGVGTIEPAVWKDASVINKQLKGVTMPDTSIPPSHSLAFTTANQIPLQYNEYICYNVSQVRLRYLLRLQINAPGY